MGKSDRTKGRAVIRTAEKGKHTGEIAPLSAGKQTTAKTDSKEEINGQRTMRKVEQKMKKTIFEEMGGTYVRCGHFSSFRLSWFQAQIPDTHGKILAPAMAEVMLGYADTPQKAITQSGGTAKRYSRRKYAIPNNLAPAVCAAPAAREYGDGRVGKRAMVEMRVEQVKHFLGFLYDFRYL